MKVTLLLNLAIVVILALLIEKQNIQQGFAEKSSIKTLEYTRCAQYGISIKKIKTNIMIDGDESEQPAIAPYGDGFIVVYTKQNQIYRALVNSEYEMIKDSNIAISGFGFMNAYSPAIVQTSGQGYLVCYLNGGNVACLVLDPNGIPIESSITNNLLGFGLGVESESTITIKIFDNGYYGIFVQQYDYDTPQYALIGSGIVSAIASNFAQNVVQNLQKLKVYAVHQYKYYYNDFDAFMQAEQYTNAGEDYLAIISAAEFGGSSPYVGLQIANFDSISSDLKTIIQVSDSGIPAVQPSMIMLDSETFFICYTAVEGSSEYDVVCKICDTDISTTGSATDYCTSAASVLSEDIEPMCLSPSITKVAEDQILITYVCYTQSQTAEIYATLLDKTGTDIIDIWRVNKTMVPGTKFYQPQATLLNNGNIGITWYDSRNEQVYAAAYEYVSSTDKNVHKTAFVLCVVLIPCGLVIASFILYLIFFRGGVEAVKKPLKQTA